MNATFDVYLKAYSGDDIDVRRIGRDDNSIKSPRLSLIQTCQTDVAKTMINNKTFRDKGAAAFLTRDVPFIARQARGRHSRYCIVVGIRSTGTLPTAKFRFPPRKQNFDFERTLGELQARRRVSVRKKSGSKSDIITLEPQKS